MKAHPSGSPRTGQGSKATVVIAISREDLAWAGGFFDGEGHVRSIGDRSYPALQIRQAGSFTAPPEVLTRFQKAVCGLGYVYGPMFAPERLEHMPQWSYEAHGFEAVQAIFAMVWPWLGPIKRAQFARVILAHSALPEPRRRAGVRVGRPLREACPNGHDYSDAYVDGAGRRSCRRCRKQRSAAFYRAQKERLDSELS